MGCGGWREGNVGGKDGRGSGGGRMVKTGGGVGKGVGLSIVLDVGVSL